MLHSLATFICLWGLATCQLARIVYNDCLDPSQAGGVVFAPVAAYGSYDVVPGLPEHTLNLQVTVELTEGSVQDLNVDTNKYTTLRIRSKVLEFTVYNEYVRFCDFASNGSTCPISQGQNFTFDYQFNVSNAYEGVSFETTFYIINNTPQSNIVGCTTVEVSPVLSRPVWIGLVCGIVGVTVIIVIAHVLSMFLNPWTGTKNIYLSTSNYGRNVNAIRLITPGFLDFIRYLQTAVLLGSLNLNYPGFFQPVLSAAAWSCLLFDVDVVSKRTEKLRAHIYLETESFGLSTMLRAIRLTRDEDAWPGFILWLIAIAFGLAAMWLVVTTIYWLLNRRTQDTRHVWREGVHFLGGVMLRLVFKIFALPLLTLAMFQIAIIPTQHPPIVADVFAVLAIALWVGCAIYLSYRIMSYSVNHELFTDLATLLLFGPLYNTYRENRTVIVVVELVAAVVQAIAIGALQVSGVAQVSVLSVVELISFLGIVFVRPFEPATNMNLVVGAMSAVRVALVFLLIPLIPSLNAGPTVRGWIAYAILLVHLLVIVMFIVHVVQVVFEILVRLGGAGTTEDVNSANKENDYGMRAYQPAAQGYGDEPVLTGQASPDRLLDSRSFSYYPPSTRKRDSAADNTLISSPTSDLSSPISANPNNVSTFGYYRRPRRRHSSLDWQFDFNDDTKTPVRETAEEPDEGEDRAKKGVDYATREADMYITKRSRTSSLLYSDDEEYHDAESQPRLSAISPIKEPNFGGPGLTHTSDGEDGKEEETLEGHGLLRPVKDLMNKMSSNFNIKKKKVKEDPYEPKGFQVLNRQPIRPNVKAGARFQMLSIPAEASEEDLGEGVGHGKAEPSETDDLLGSDMKPGQPQAQSSPAMFQIPLQSKSISTGLRVDTGSKEEMKKVPS